MKIILNPTSFVVELTDDLSAIKGTTDSMVPFINRNNLVEYEMEPASPKNNFRPTKSTVKYKYFRLVDKKLVLPRGFFRPFVRFYDCQPEVEAREGTEPRKVSFRMQTTFVDRPHQIEPIKFLCDTSKPIRALELQTGKGKTYCAIRAISELGLVTMIVAPAYLLEMWERSLRSMIDIDDDRIGILRGRSSFDKLRKQQPSIILASITTLSDNLEDGTVERFIEDVGVGVKVVDECHMNFHANVMIDLTVNIRNNLYLSATYMRSSHVSDRIIRNVFIPEFKFDSLTYDKYANVTEASYSLGYQVPPSKTETKRGYSQFKFEKYILKKPGTKRRLFDEVFPALIDEFYINVADDNEKLLILTGLRDFATELVARLEDHYPEKVVSVFFSEHDESVLENSDIIVSTPGSAGTGRDIKGLRTLISFVSFSSKTLTYQVLGRLRKIKGSPEFVYMVCSNVQHHIRHARNRLPIYKSIAKKLDSRKL